MIKRFKRCECGGMPVVEKTADGKWTIRCPFCNKSLGSAYEDKKETVNAWNEMIHEIDWNVSNDVFDGSPLEYWKEIYLPSVPKRFKCHVIDDSKYGKEFYAAVRDNKTKQVYALIAIIEKEKDIVSIKQTTGDNCPNCYHAAEKICSAVTESNHEKWINKCRKVRKRELDYAKTVNKVIEGKKIQFEKKFSHNGVQWDTLMMIDRKKCLFRIDGLKGIFRIPWWKNINFKIVN